MLDNRYEYREGQFVSQKVAQVVEAIHEYCPDIEVQYVPAAQRTNGEVAAYRLIHNIPGGAPYVIFHVKNEDEFDARVLKRLIMGDQRFGNGVTLTELEATEIAAKAVAKQRFLDEIEEANEVAAAILRSPKDTYKVNDNLIVHQSKRFTKKQKPNYLK